ncbi:MAG: preprotein translocase subunit SecE [Desulfobacterales bacterium]|jgi:preprotein translocase subunit SecE|nr:preprotein translocase subunit SecE [Desulfobacterales bacterium]
MGRILRKKPVGLKKKKRQNDEASSSEGAGDSASGTPGGAAAAEAAAPRKAPAAVVPVPVAPPADNFWTRSVQFLREVKTELKKVTWPTRQQTLGSTAVVLVLVLIISLFLGLVDMGLAGIVGLIFR